MKKITIDDIEALVKSNSYMSDLYTQRRDSIKQEVGDGVTFEDFVMNPSSIPAGLYLHIILGCGDQVMAGMLLCECAATIIDYNDGNPPKCLDVVNKARDFLQKKCSEDELCESMDNATAYMMKHYVKKRYSTRDFYAMESTKKIASIGEHMRVGQTGLTKLGMIINFLSLLMDTNTCKPSYVECMRYLRQQITMANARRCDM